MAIKERQSSTFMSHTRVLEREVVKTGITSNSRLAFVPKRVDSPVFLFVAMFALKYSSKSLRISSKQLQERCTCCRLERARNAYLCTCPLWGWFLEKKIQVKMQNPVCMDCRARHELFSFTWQSLDLKNSGMQLPWQNDWDWGDFQTCILTQTLDPSQNFHVIFSGFQIRRSAVSYCVLSAESFGLAPLPFLCSGQAVFLLIQIHIPSVLLTGSKMRKVETLKNNFILLLSPCVNKWKKAPTSQKSLKCLSRMGKRCAWQSFSVGVWGLSFSNFKPLNIFSLNGTFCFAPSSK